VSPKWKSLVARVTLVGGIALVSTYFAKSAPHDQQLAIRCSGHNVSHLTVVLTKLGPSGAEEPTAGFSQDFPRGAPSLVRHTFSAPNGTYIVVITFTEPVTGDLNPIPTETTFERRVSLAGGEVIVSPD
jgi:hypothetical protein